MTGKPIHLLLIEDNRGDARLVVEMLKDAAGPKTSCSHVETLAEGRDLSAKEDFDLILLDLSLPDGQGLESLAKAREFAPNIPVVVLTGMMGEELAFDAIRGGAQDYLIKGQFDGNLIIRCIRYSIERQRSENLIQRRVEFEKLIGSISNSFLNMAPENLDEEIGETMKLVGEFIGVDRSYFGYTTNEGKTMRVMRGWRREGVDSLPKMEAEMEEFSWLAEKIRGFSTIALSSLDELPDEAAAERKALEERGAKATLCVPLAFDGAPVGFLGVDAVGQKRVWEPMEERLLKMAGDIIVNACERRRTNERNALLVAAVEQAGEAIVITNPEGIIEYVNPTFEKNSGYKWEEAIGKKKQPAEKRQP